jgi:hypothetical protein
VRDELRAIPNTGFMLTQMMGNRPDVSSYPWAADNGCFATPHRFSEDGYTRWLTRNRDCRQTCLFATAPDVVANARATLDRAVTWLPKLRALGYPAALIAQDGLEAERVPWDAFDALFIGGSTSWKLGRHAARLVGDARRRGKWVHMGRVNSYRRLRLAEAMGCDSVDGTFLAFAPLRNLPVLARWLERLRCEPLLPFDQL